MIDETASQHIQRLKLATTEKLQRKDLGNWVTKNTFLNGKPFSTAGHEYQTKIMEDDAPEIVIKRSAQIGISEMSLRMTLGLVSIRPNFSAIYTMPTATLAGVYTKTRLDSIIQGSPFLKDAVRGDLDSAEVKQLGLNNFMYMREPRWAMPRSRCLRTCWCTTSSPSATRRCRAPAVPSTSWASCVFRLT